MFPQDINIQYGMNNPWKDNCPYTGIPHCYASRKLLGIGGLFTDEEGQKFDVDYLCMHCGYVKD